MIENIRAEFRNMLKTQVDWMDTDSKQKADEKVTANLIDRLDFIFQARNLISVNLI